MDEFLAFCVRINLVLNQVSETYREQMLLMLLVVEEAVVSILVVVVAAFISTEEVAVVPGEYCVRNHHFEVSQ